MRLECPCMVPLSSGWNKRLELVLYLTLHEMISSVFSLNKLNCSPRSVAVVQGTLAFWNECQFYDTEERHSFNTLKLITCPWSIVTKCDVCYGSAYFRLLHSPSVSALLYSISSKDRVYHIFMIIALLTITLSQLIKKPACYKHRPGWLLRAYSKVDIVSKAAQSKQPSSVKQCPTFKPFGNYLKQFAYNLGHCLSSRVFQG